MGGGSKLSIASLAGEFCWLCVCTIGEDESIVARFLCGVNT